MPRLLCVCLLCLGLLFVRFSRELSEISRARRLCGTHLLKEIIKLCGNVNWSYFEEETPKPPLFPQDNEIETFIPYRSESSQTTFPAWARGTNPDLNSHVYLSCFLSLLLPLRKKR
ncbi:insulin-like peptide INSL6 isoform X2 [Halichoerus grypus]|uniref:insulin-like peptide INSL6 isoform X2 n=1 Tax=Phoca vitulina TaxID=9720 RepID=UPI001395FB54|nr:insulin-like peptide INSL6 isoform X2 [Phoca vitulina]XP_035957147.1 insulin-like peptide INSL6 isoform X2 [Halichoerus grypus]